MSTIFRVLSFSIPTLACMLGVLFSLRGKMESSVKTQSVFFISILLTALSTLGDGAAAAVTEGSGQPGWYYLAMALLFVRPLHAVLPWFLLKNSRPERYISLVLCACFSAVCVCSGILNPGLFSDTLSQTDLLLLLYRLSILLAGVIVFCAWTAFFIARKKFRLRSGMMIFALVSMILSLIMDLIYVEAPNFSQFISIVLVVAYLNNLLRRIDGQVEELKKSQHAELMASQIQPHFLFNALNAIYELCGKDPEAARSTIDAFSTFLRMNLRRLGNYMVPFTDELMHMDAYLRIEQLRFGTRLRVIKNIQEENFMLPPLTLQPLVENAVRHGVCKKEEGGTVYIYSRRIPEGVEVIVEDDGAGFDTSVPIDEKKHVGVANVRQRLKYMADGELIIESEPGKGTKAVIRLLV